MSTETIRRELRVAFSIKAQPIWFRTLKWVLIIAVVWRYHSKKWFWQALGAAFIASITLHLFYRYKTDGWRRAWGGWDDLGAGGAQLSK